MADTFIQGSASDPFVTFQLGDEYLRSSCVSGALDPVWQPAETFEFEVGHLSPNAERHLVVQVVDNDRFKMDDLLGELRLPLSSFERRPNEAIVETYELQVPESLQQATKQSDKKSTIQLDICYAEETDGQRTLCIWENEDWVDGKWTPSHNNERRHWSTYDLQTSSDNFDQVAPEVPEGLEGAGWAYTTKKGTTTAGSTPAPTRGRGRPQRPHLLRASSSLAEQLPSCRRLRVNKEDTQGSCIELHLVVKRGGY